MAILLEGDRVQSKTGQIGTCTRDSYAAGLGIMVTVKWDGSKRLPRPNLVDSLRKIADKPAKKTSSVSLRYDARQKLIEAMDAAIEANDDEDMTAMMTEQRDRAARSFGLLAR